MGNKPNNKITFDTSNMSKVFIVKWSQNLIFVERSPISDLILKKECKKDILVFTCHVTIIKWSKNFTRTIKKYFCLVI